jgi:hypothetical protein
MTREAEASDRGLDTVGQKRPPLGAGLKGSPESLVPYSLGWCCCVPPGVIRAPPHRDVTRFALVGGGHLWSFATLPLCLPLQRLAPLRAPRASPTPLLSLSLSCFRLLATCLRGRTATSLLFGDGPKLTLKASAKRALGPRYIAMGVRRDKRETGQEVVIYGACPRGSSEHPLALFA